MSRISDAEAVLERPHLAVQVHPRALRERLELLDLLLEIDDRLLELESVGRDRRGRPPGAG